MLSSRILRTRMERLSEATFEELCLKMWEGLLETQM